MKTLLIDSQYLAHRAKNAFVKRDGHVDKSGVIFGFLFQIQQLANRFESNRFIFCWDSVFSIRKQEFPEYKEKRNNHKEELTEDEIEFNNSCFRQFDIIRNEVIETIGFRNNYIQSWYETDDLIAMIVLHRPELDSIIVTRDNDFLQLLNFADIFDPQSKKLITKSDFQKKWGIDPDLWAEVKAIAGCKSDCIPGISGVGEPTAIKYIKGKLNPNYATYRSIVQGKDVIERNRKLVTLPYPGTKLFVIKEDAFNFDDFHFICNKYALDYFLKPSQLNWWRGFFEGFGYNDNKSYSDGPKLAI